MDGHHLYRTEEFKALCRLLGIGWDLLTKDMVITIPEDGEVTVTQTYNTDRHPDARLERLKLFDLHGVKIDKEALDEYRASVQKGRAAQGQGREFI